MRLARWLVILTAFAYAAYTGFLGFADYAKVSTVVQNALARQPTERWADRASAVHDTIVRDVRVAGIPLEDRDVVVTETDRQLRVRATWSHAMLVVRGQTLFWVPIWLERSAPLAE
jgi:hypothetical protein